MSEVSNRLERLAETHCVNPLTVLEMYEERVAIMEADGIRDAERLALEDIERELEGRR